MKKTNFNTSHNFFVEFSWAQKKVNPNPPTINAACAPKIIHLPKQVPYFKKVETIS